MKYFPPLTISILTFLQLNDMVASPMQHDASVATFAGEEKEKVLVFKGMKNCSESVKTLKNIVA